LNFTEAWLGSRYFLLLTAIFSNPVLFTRRTLISGFLLVETVA
jgi:hypothetical protein